jgi:transposase
MSGRAFIASDRDQVMLLPPDIRDWLPADHLVWMVLDTVAVLDLSAFYEVARRQPRSRPGYQPSLLVALLVYGYTVGVRSSREIERRTREDVAFRAISAGHTLDHATIARFRARFAEDLAGLFEQVLAVCFASGMGRVGSIAIDGTKIAVNAARHQNRTREQLPTLRQTAERLIAEAEAADRREDELYGSGDGGCNDLPPALADPTKRREAIRRACNRLAGIARAEQELAARDEAAAQAHEQRLVERAAEERAQGSRFRGPSPQRPVPDGAERVNLTDPQSRLQKTANGGHIQGVNAQFAVSDDHLVLTTRVCQDRADQHQFQPVVEDALAVLARVAPAARVNVVVADYGYFSNANAAAFPDTLQVLIAPGGRRREDQPPDHSIETCPARKQLYDALQDPTNRARYKRRGATVEPVIGDIKENKNGDRFSRRGQDANGFELRLMALAHNLSRLHNHRRAQPA